MAEPAPSTGPSADEPSATVPKSGSVAPPPATLLQQEMSAAIGAAIAGQPYKLSQAAIDFADEAGVSHDDARVHIQWLAYRSLLEVPSPLLPRRYPVIPPAGGPSHR